jgi:hypothetical protein
MAPYPSERIDDTGRAARRHLKDIAAYDQACRCADGDEVQEIEAVAVQPDMTVWHSGRWLQVMFRRATSEAVMLDFVVPEPGGTAYRVVSPGAPMYRRIATATRAATEDGPLELETAP